MFLSLKNFLRFLLPLAGFWLVFFTVFRITFLLYHHAPFGQLGWGPSLSSVFHGWYMDASMCGYFLIIPLLLWLAKDVFSPGRWRKIISTYTLVLVFISSLMLTADLEIFTQWGHRIDAAILPYLRFPKEAIASSAAAPFRILFTIFGLGFIIPAMLWAAFHIPLLRKSEARNGLGRFWTLAAVPFLILVLRGGFQLAPMNQSSVYFSTERALNQAAENGLWVFMHSVLQQSDEDFDQSYAPYPSGEVEAEKEIFWPPTSDSSQIKLKPEKPNIILIVWESLTAKVVGHLGGAFPSTPTLDSLSRHGITFQNLFANGDRSDKGLVSLLSAMPALGKRSIMFEPNLTAGLPFLPQDLRKNGWQTKYLYGGDLGFANMKSYMLQAGFQEIIGDADFPKSQQNSKWGAHDGALFQKHLDLAKPSKEPFFHCIFTLSSHEPFEVPGVINQPGEPMDSLFCRSHRYTDRCLHDWLQQAKKASWWKNTLVIVVADHGHAAPGKSPEGAPEKYHIPMVWFGPALGGQTLQYQGFANQTDLAATLLSALHIKPEQPFPFSRNLLSGRSDFSALYSFRNGMGMQGPAGSVQNIDEEGKRRSFLLRQAVYQQYFQVRK